MAAEPLIVTMLLAADRPPFRTLWEGELPEVPATGEPLSFNGRQYRVLERSWRFGNAATQEDTVLGPMNGPAKVRVGVGLLLEQIGGPSHVALVSGG
jgi:hypothetical protein